MKTAVVNLFSIARLKQQIATVAAFRFTKSVTYLPTLSYGT
ncbi:hypothetical protein [Nostoc sp. NMS7]|nr:hypothetical protein [Nostoc sp. NMS7]